MNPTEAMVEIGAAGMYGSKWNSPDETERPGEKMKDVWRKYARDCLTAALSSMLEEGWREDAERLDWMENVNVRTNFRNNTVYGWRYDINHNRAALTDCNLPALTVREAIDCARFPKRRSEIELNSIKEGARKKAFLERNRPPLPVQPKEDRG